MAKSRATSKAKRSIRQMKSDVFEQVLESELDELTRVKRWCHAALKIAVMVWQDFFDNLVKLQAMALAFKTLLSLAPLLAVLFSILKAFGVHNRMEPAMAEALAPLGDKGREITAYLIGFVDKMSAGALGAVGLVTLFLTVLSLMHSIEEAFNRIW
ncbi:MAG TPA: YhjD/YihY/BrkB family envelope integrity protein, partial [Candidatus Deferrimicrobium sp.]|nr:YhjD/YihY/BrkB family envelope integrity protein [Candidatus Deferrimicrobium sp.]